MIVIAWWLAISLASTLVWCVLMWKREQQETPRTLLSSTTPVLRLADDIESSGLGMPVVHPSDVHWVELPEDPSKWLEAVAK